MEDDTMTVPNIADRRQKHQDAAQRLETMLNDLMDTDTFRRYLTAMSRFHRYSWANVAMILSQRPTATRVNSYKRWQGIGRQVKQGEKGIAIWTPRTRKNADGDHELTGFGIGYIFDISQTDGDELPDAPAVERLDGSSPRTAAAHDVILDLIAARGVTFSRLNTHPALGYWKPRQRLIAVDDTITGNMALSVTVHETAHMLADHRGAIDKADAESVAEGAAFVVMSYLDVDTSRFSVPYIAGWAQDPDTLRSNLAEVQHIAHTIIEHYEDAMTDALDLADAA
jgi:hypothetical protein